MRFPSAEVAFESTGALHDPAQRTAAVDLVVSSGATDVVVLVHGWNNDIPAARALYERLTDSVAEIRNRVPSAAARTLAVVGVLWPSIRWADADDVAGGGVSVGDEQLALMAAIDERIEDPAAVAQLRRLVPKLETSADARQKFLDTLRVQLPPPIDGDEEPPPVSFLEGDAEQVFDQAGGPETDFGAPETPGGAAAGVSEAEVLGGSAAAFSFGGVLDGARNLLNLTSYYTMRERAGNVGFNGVAGLLDALAAGAPRARRHLVGHSFGARVVSAAAARHAPVHSVTLLQGAFSHHGFASNFDGRGGNGLFRAVLAGRRLTGPLLATHTANDKAVGLAYAIASRLAGQAGTAVGGPDDLYGGIGRNGALKTPEVAQPAGSLLAVGGAYSFTAGNAYNLKADAFISSHSAVTGPEVASALLQAMVS